MAAVQVAVVGKFQSTAYTKATTVSPSPNIPALSESLISDANSLWDDLSARVQNLIFPDYSLFKRGQFTLGSVDYTVGEYVRAIAALTGASDGVAADVSAAVVASANEYFDKFVNTNASLVDGAMSDIQSIYNTVDNAAFRVQMAMLCTTYGPAIKTVWASEGGSLRAKFTTDYATMGASAFTNMATFITERHDVVVAGAQTLSLQALFAAIKVVWENTFIADRLKSIETAMQLMQQETQSREVYIRNDGSTITQAMNYPKITTLRPFDVVSITADEAPLFRGYPTNPKLWVRCRPLLSSDGEIVSTARSTPAEFTLDSDERWIADADYWDVASGIWLPINDRFHYTVRSDQVANRPELNSLTYVRNKELITRSSFRMSNGASLNCHFNNGHDSLTTFTFSMVIMPNPTARPYPILDYWNGDIAPENGDRFGWWANDRIDFYYGGTGGSVDPLIPLTKARPMVITSVVNNGQCTTTVGYSYRHNMSTVIKSAVADLTQWLRFQIGGTYYEISDDERADFNLFEVNLWSKALSGDEVSKLHSDYYSMYGVTNDWR